MNFFKLFFLSIAVSLLTSCYSMINKGIVLSSHDMDMWKRSPSNIDRMLLLDNICDGKNINVQIVGYEYVSWIGPLFPIPFIPSIFNNVKQDIDMSLVYPYLTAKRIEDCPVIQINKGIIKKAYTIKDKDICRYSFHEPEKDFNLSFIEKVPFCKLEQLNLKIHRYIKYDLWTFNG